MNLKFDTNEKIDLILIAVSAASVIVSFITSTDYIASIAVILCGIPIFKDCVFGLVLKLDIKTDLLVTIAIIASIIIGEVFAAGEIATIMAIGGFLEEYTTSKAQKQIENLVKMTPQVARRIRNGKEEKIDVDEVEIGDTLKVLPGEGIPTDGVIISGETSVDQSSLTGESIPADKSVKDEVYSGTVNLYGSFTMKTTKVSEDSSMQKLIKLVESAKPENSNIVRLADKWATWIVAVAFITSLITYFITGEIIRSVTILVVFCPCALVLATPTAIMAAISNLTGHGILVKNGRSIEELSGVNELVFDKTGTLTYGTPEVVKTVGEKETMQLLASLEGQSEHPLAKAVVKSYTGEMLKVSDFKMHPGKGVSGTVGDSKVIAGNSKLLKENNISLKYAKSDAIEIYVAKNGEVIGKVLLADKLREESKHTITRLSELGIKTCLLTGDNRQSGENVAGKVKVTDAHFNCLPQDKLNYIKNSQINGNKVAMIGDGINDAPSLKKANVGIAMGKIGSDISIEAADIALINDNISDIPHLIEISRKTIKTINISIGFSLILNISAMILAMFGVLGPIAGALIHNIGSVVVIIYSITLLNFKNSKNSIKRFNISKNVKKSHKISKI